MKVYAVIKGIPSRRSYTELKEVFSKRNLAEKYVKSLIRTDIESRSAWADYYDYEIHERELR